MSFLDLQGPGATVLAPAALVAKVKEGLKGALANYCDKDRG